MKEYRERGNNYIYGTKKRSVDLFALLPTLLQVDFFALKDGYSFIWLAVCYMIGAYLWRLESEEQGMLRVFLFEKLGVSRIMRAGAEKVDERIYLE